MSDTGVPIGGKMIGTMRRIGYAFLLAAMCVGCSSRSNDSNPGPSDGSASDRIDMHVSPDSGAPGSLSWDADGGALSAFDFGTVVLGDQATALFTLHNGGTRAVEVSVAISGADKFDFAVIAKQASSGAPEAGADADIALGDAGPLPLSLAPGGATRVEVIFRPTAVGSRDATLALTSGSTSISLSGKGVCPTIAPAHFEQPGVQAACGKGIFIGVGNLTERMISTNGTTWTHILDDRTDPDGMASGCLTCDDDAFDAIFHDGLIVVASESGIYTSADGAATWKKAPPPAPTGIVAGGGPHVAAGAYGNGFFMVANGENTYKSEDGYTWTTMVDGNPSGCNQIGRGSLLFGNGTFFAICGAYNSAPNTTGQVYKTTTDGMTWQHIVNSTTNEFLSAAFGHGLFVAIGAGFHATSPDAGTWTLVKDMCTDPGTWTGPASGCLGNLANVIFDGTNFLACGSQGCFASPDGTTWTQVYKTSVSNLMTYGNGLYILNQGSKDIVSSSPSTFLTPTPVNYPTTNYIEHIVFGYVLARSSGDGGDSD